MINMSIERTFSFEWFFTFSTNELALLRMKPNLKHFDVSMFVGVVGPNVREVCCSERV